MARTTTTLWALALLLLAAGCGDGAETGSGTGGAGGGAGGGAPAECSIDDTFDSADCPASYPAYQCVVYVDGDRTTSGDGWSWAGAVKTVQEGIDRARCGADEAGVCAQWQVWVKEGTYYVHQGCRFDYVRLRSKVGVYGGFDGSETTVYDRDSEQNETILDGRDGPDGAEHVYHVVRGADDSTLDGFIVQGGRADHDSDYIHQYGAGMGNVSASPWVENCTFRDNYALVAGAGMANDHSAPTVVGCHFEGNQAENGAGMVNQSSAPTVSGSYFEGNTATNGAGMSNQDSAPTVSGCHFEGNQAESGAGMSNGDGSVTTVRDSTFANNSATADGGAILAVGSELILSDTELWGNTAGSSGGGLGVGSGSATVIGCDIQLNAAPIGGGVAAWDSAEVTIADSRFDDNLAAVVVEDDPGVGGGLHIAESTATVVDSSFSGNTADLFGGGIAAQPAADLSLSGCDFDGNHAGNNGGGVHVNKSQVTVTGCDFDGNTADNYAAGMSAIDSTATVEDSIFSNNAAVGMVAEAGGLSLLSGDAEVRGCLFHNNEAISGGGAMMVWYGASVLLENSVLDGNSSDKEGGGLAVQDGSIEVDGCAFTANAATKGGGMAIWNTTATIRASQLQGNIATGIAGTSRGGGMFTGGGAAVDVVSSVFFANAASAGSGIYADAGAGPLSLLHCTMAGNAPGVATWVAADLAIGNSILWNPDASAEIEQSGSVLEVSHSDVRGFTGGTANLDVDPLFVDLPGGDLHLQATSSCIDAGDPVAAPPLDLEGNPRVGDPDMGAFEHP